MKMKWIDASIELPNFFKVEGKEFTQMVPVIRKNPTKYTQNFLLANAVKKNGAVIWYDDRLIEVDVAMWFPGVEPEMGYIAFEFKTFPEGDKKEAVRRMLEEYEMDQF